MTKTARSPRSRNPVSALASLVILVSIAGAGTVGAQAGPDLRVAAFDLEDGPSSHQFAVTVVNDGDATAPGFMVRVDEEGSTVTRSVSTGTLAAGAQRTLVVFWPTWIYGEANFTATADASAVVAEPDESDNALTIPVDLGFPDLRVTAVTSLGAADVADEPVRIQVTVENQGPGTAHDVGWNVTRSGAHVYGATHPGALPPGASFTETFPWRLPEVGSHVIAAMADSPYLIPETLENNNVLHTTITATAPAALGLNTSSLQTFDATTDGAVEHHLSLVARTFGDHVPWKTITTFLDGGAAVGTVELQTPEWPGAWQRVDDDHYEHVVVASFTHLVTDGHTPEYTAMLRVDADRPWGTTFTLSTTPVSASGPLGPPVFSGIPYLNVASIASPDGLYTYGSNLTVVARVENHGPDPIPGDLVWSYGTTSDELERFGRSANVVVPAYGETNVSHTFLLDRSGLVGLFVEFVPPGADPADGDANLLATGTASFMVTRPSGLSVALEPDAVSTDDLGWTVIRLRVRADAATAAVRMEVVDDGGHFVHAFDFPTDVAEGNGTVFEVQAYPDRSRAPQRDIVVRAVGLGAASAPFSVNAASIAPAGDGPELAAPAASGAGYMVIGFAVVGVGGVAGLAYAAVWANEARRFALLKRLLSGGAAVGLFSRIQGPKALEHGTREEIHRLVRGRPGVHYREIQRSLKLSNGRLAHHLHTLEREGLVRTEETGRLVRFFPVGVRVGVGAALTPRQAVILGHVQKNPGILQSALAGLLGVTRQALHQHVDALRQSGLLLSTGAGRSNALYLEMGADQRLARCRSCATVYDRGPILAGAVVCPACGQA